MSEHNQTIEAVPFQRAEAVSNEKRLALSPIKIGITLIFLILLIIVSFMFLAKAIKIETQPATDSIHFTSGLQYKIGERYLMLSGKYNIAATLTGYEDLEQSFQVGSAADQDFIFKLTKLPGILKLKTTPPTNAEIYIDQALIGEFSNNNSYSMPNITPGLHDISIRSKRFKDYDTEVEIEGKRIEQNLNLVLVPAWADINFSSQPNADILIDGELNGRTPNTIEVIQGEHTVEIQKSGYKTWQSVINVVASKTQNIANILLEKADGKVAINSKPVGANVSINGQFKGQTPLQLILAPGTNYRIKLSKAGYTPLDRKFTLTADEDLSLNNTLNPITGIVQLMIEPNDATLSLDGEILKKASQRLTLTAHHHEIVISKPGFASFTTTITPQPGSTQQLIVRLQTEAEARIAAIPTTIQTTNGETLKLIIPGTFEMGASRREPGRRSNEIQKSVELTRSFYLSIAEVTNKQFKQFNAAHDSGIIGRALLNEDDRPVVNVTWQQAAAYCNWLSRSLSLPLAYKTENGILKAVQPLNTGFRLPTEAEWVWSARYAGGPVAKRFPWGNNMPPTEVSANYADVSATAMVPYNIAGYDDGYRGPSPAGTFPPNELGIMDLAGNVSEWIHDFYSVKIPRKLLTDPTGPEKGDYYVIRGSSYQHGRFSELRWTYRDYGSKSRFDVGFRIARYLED